MDPNPRRSPPPKRVTGRGRLAGFTGLQGKTRHELGFLESMKLVTPQHRWWVFLRWLGSKMNPPPMDPDLRRDPRFRSESGDLLSLPDAVSGSAWCLRACFQRSGTPSVNKLAKEMTAVACLGHGEPSGTGTGRHGGGCPTLLQGKWKRNRW